jgi:dolichol kinase
MGKKHKYALDSALLRQESDKKRGWYGFCSFYYMMGIIQKNELLRPMKMSMGSLDELKTEVVRKSIHFLIALSPAMAAMNRLVTMAILAAGILVYAYIEKLRLSGVNVPLISSVINMAARSRDVGRFVLGPVTLGLGALLSLLLFPAPVAAIAIYALAFGDGFSSLVGKCFGRVRPAFLRGKSLEGSITCFAVVFFAAYEVSRDYRSALIAGITAMLVEALPLQDYDNLAIPLAVGFILNPLL